MENVDVGVRKIGVFEFKYSHFDKPQVTVFTAFVVLGSNNKNFVIINDYLEHVSSS